MTAEAVTVIIPTWLRAEPLRECIQGVVSQGRLPDELIVVGRPVDEDAKAVVEEIAAEVPFPVRWVDVHRPGHVAPIIAGRDALRTPWVAIVDDDVVPLEGWLEALIAPLERPDVACVGGRVVQPPSGWHGQPWPDAGSTRWYGRLAANVSSRETDGPEPVDTVPEGNWAWKTEILRDVVFDPVIDHDDASMYGLDLTMQAKEAGYEILFDSAARVYESPAPRDPSIDKTKRTPRVRAYCRNYTYIALRHIHGWRRAVFYAWWWGVGERLSYGLIKAAFDLVVRSNRRDTWDLTVASFSGRNEGLRKFRAAQRTGATPRA